MKTGFTKLVILALFCDLALTLVVYAQQTAPKDVLPPKVQPTTPSQPLSTVTPNTLYEPSVKPFAMTPQAPPPPAEQKLETVKPVATAPNDSQPVAQDPGKASEVSAWDRTNTVPNVQWGKPETVPAGSQSPTKSPSDPWAVPPTGADHRWDQNPPVNSSGTKTEWK